MTKKKFYVIWKGKKTGVFDSLEQVKSLVHGFKGAEYKSFSSKQEAIIASKKEYQNYKGKDTNKPILTEKQKEEYGTPVANSLTVDAACSGNPGVMEYRGVLNINKKEVFKQGPFQKGTNNIGEFLALVHGLALLKKKGFHNMPIYSDSKIAISWIKQKKCKTKLNFTTENKELKNLIIRAENWLQENSYKNPILKWHTKVWGEIPADFGRK